MVFVAGAVGGLYDLGLFLPPLDDVAEAVVFSDIPLASELLLPLLVRRVVGVEVEVPLVFPILLALESVLPLRLLRPLPLGERLTRRGGVLELRVELLLLGLDLCGDSGVDVPLRVFLGGDSGVVPGLALDWRGLLRPF